MKQSVEGEKYTFEVKDGVVKCARFGEEWVTFSEGSKAIIALMAFAEHQAGRVKYLESVIDKVQIDVAGVILG